MGTSRIQCWFCGKECEGVRDFLDHRVFKHREWDVEDPLNQRIPGLPQPPIPFSPSPYEGWEVWRKVVERSKDT